MKQQRSQMWNTRKLTRPTSRLRKICKERLCALCMISSDDGTSVLSPDNLRVGQTLDGSMGADDHARRYVKQITAEGTFPLANLRQGPHMGDECK